METNNKPYTISVPYRIVVKPCSKHTLAIPSSLKETGSWKETFKKKRGYEPKECPECGYLIFEEGTIDEKLRDLKGSIAGKPEEKLVEG